VSCTPFGLSSEGAHTPARVSPNRGRSIFICGSFIYFDARRMPCPAHALPHPLGWFSGSVRTLDGATSCAALSSPSASANQMRKFELRDTSHSVPD
jgi:hypothetical protein